MRVPVCSLILSIVASPSLAGSFYTGNQLLDICGADGNACVSYIMGVADTMGDGPVYGWTARIPGGVTGNQLKAISLRFFNEHMEIAQKGAGGIIAEALAQSFPCRK
jgi:hypothetical protein